ncbi:MAG: DUF4892 domain-containing protein [Cellvibrionaceae bacterium]|nr:DUF4892 domain-containing protein [Cellvibrionaceae bacterium]
MRKLLIVLLFSQSVLANEPVFKNFFENQRRVFKQDSRVDDFRLALSKLKKINNAWVLDREEFISGTLHRLTIELDSTYYLNEVIDIAENYFLQQQALELFRCNGLDCGSSNAWANNYFKIKLLYGLDPSQSYRVWRLKINGNQTLVSNYIVQRGNKRIYVHLDVLIPESQQTEGSVIPPDSKSIAFALEKFKYYLVPQLENSRGFATSNRLLQPVADALKANPVKKVVVVGHDYVGATAEDRKKNSLGYAEQVASLLRDLGVKDNRLSAQGLGSLVPQLKVAPAAVYLVLD